MASSVRSLLFSDIEGSTELLRRAGPRYPELLNVHRRIVREELAATNGIEHGTVGDSFFLSFDSPTDAIATAVRIQRRLESESWPADLRIRVRIGVHIGEVIDNDGDLVGMAIHHAARLSACAHGGQIITSEAMSAMITELPDGVDLVSVGSHRLRDMGTTELLQVVHPDLQRSFPPLHSSSVASNNLPQTLTAFVGGSDEMEQLRALVARSPLVTLTGPGGVGKTRRVIELGWSCLDRFDAGVWLVELANVRDVEEVQTTLAATLSIRPQPHVSLMDSIVEWCHERRLMLIIDNCEHLLSPVRELVRVLVGQCPTIKVVATSREPLGMVGERVHPVQVLRPDIDGLALFLDRATAADSSFVLSDHERPLVVEICQRLDGLPLAIELAAARVRSMAPADLLHRLGERFKLLRGGASESDRHATVRATVAWSYQLLTDLERLLFDRVSVFAGGFDLDAAETVCGDDDLDQADIVDLLSSLVDKSMVVADREPDGARYRLLETMHQFGHDNLVASGALDAVGDRHLDHYIDLAERAETLYLSSMQLTGRAIFNREWDNLRAAHMWAIQTHDLQRAERILAATDHFAFSLHRVEFQDWVERTLALAVDGRNPTPDTCARGAWWAFHAEDMDRRAELATRGIDLLDRLDTPEAVLSLLCLDDDMHPRVPRPGQYLEVAAAHLDDDRDWWILLDLVEHAAVARWPSHTQLRTRLAEVADRVRAPRLMNNVAMEMGHEELLGPDHDAAAALRHYERALEIARESDDAVAVGEGLRAITFIRTSTNEEGALRVCRDALAANYDTRYWLRVWQMFDSVACNLLAASRPQAAATIVGYLDSHFEPFSIEMQLGLRESSRGAVHARADLDVDRRRGAAMNRFEIVEFALAQLDEALATSQT